MQHDVAHPGGGLVGPKGVSEDVFRKRVCVHEGGEGAVKARVGAGAAHGAAAAAAAGGAPRVALEGAHERPHEAAATSEAEEQAHERDAAGTTCTAPLPIRVAPVFGQRWLPVAEGGGG